MAMGTERIYRKANEAAEKRPGRSSAAELSLHRLHDTIAGRMRLEVLGLFRNPDLAARIEQTLGEVAGIEHVYANPLTGRMLVRFNPETTHHDIFAQICQALGAHARQTRIPETKKVEEAGLARPPGSSKRALRPRPALRLITPAQGDLPPRPGLVASVPESAHEEAWHTLTPDEVMAALETDATSGLSEAQAAERVQRWGRNAISESPPVRPEAILVRQFTNLPVGMLLVSAVVSLATGGAADAVITLAVVGINAAMGFATEIGSERAIRRMSRKQTSQVRAVRLGRDVLVDEAEIAPGDILALYPNTVIAADARLISTDQLQLNEALLTGESEPVEKAADMVLPARTPLADRHNMVHRGSFVVSGEGRAIVTATGERSQVGQVAEEARRLSTPQTPLERDLDQLGQRLAMVAIGASVLFVSASLLRQRPLFGVLKSALALAVAAVPEGLPMTATTTLALGLQALKRKGVVVRRLEAVEGLGSLQVVCFDKTGTLTTNDMRLEEVILPSPARTVQPYEGIDAATRLAAGKDAALQRLLSVALLCSDTEITESPDGLRADGSATESALAQGALDLGLNHAELRDLWPQIRAQYRSEGRRYMQTLHRNHASEHRLIAVKGDPRQVLGLCNRFLTPDGRTEMITEEDRRLIREAADASAGKGLRVLGFAYAEGPCVEEDTTELVWLGAAGLRNAPMRGARELIARLRQAGVRPVMITGDQAATAEAIATDLGMTGDRPVRVLDSRDLDQLDPQLLSVVAQKTDVFARIPPTQKLHIVESLQRAGFVVGMTGDGFNDAPALRAADIAIAVGTESASVARDVADVIVAEGDLAAIGDGVEQGRAILSNIRKSVHFMASTNLSEILVLIMEALLPGDQMESPLELLWLNLVTDILPGLGLALEPPGEGIMNQPPRSRSEPLLGNQDLAWSAMEATVLTAGIMGAHAYGLSRYGPGPQTRTVTFMSMVTAQLLHALTCRHDRTGVLAGRSVLSNNRLNAALGGSMALQAMAFLSPTLRRFLAIAPPRPGDLVTAAACGLSVFAINETIARARLRQGAGR